MMPVARYYLTDCSTAGAPIIPRISLFHRIPAMIRALAIHLVRFYFLGSRLTLLDKCGNSAVNLYSYVQIGQSSGTMSSSAVPSTASISTETKPTTSTASKSIATVTVNRGTTLVITSFVPSEPTITASSAGSRSSGDTLPHGSSVSTNQPSNATQASQVKNSDDPSPSFWNSAGKVAGVFIAVGVVLLIVVLGLLWKCRKRDSSKDLEKPEVLPQPMARQMSGGQTVSRSTSLLQLLGRRERGRPDEDISPPNRLSRSPTEMVIPVVDQRLDPQSMMIRFDDNDSRTSFRDEEDYSRRVWRVTNASDSDSLRSNEAGERYEKT